MSKLNESNETSSIKLVKVQYYEQITLKTYLNNLPEKLQIITKCRNPQSIEEAINIVKSEEADNELKQRFQNKIQKPNIPTNKTNFTQRPIFYRQPVLNPFNQPHVNPTNIPHFNNFRQQHPMPIRPHFQANNNFPTNFQNNFPKTPFMPNSNLQNNWPRSNSNVFKPNSNVAKFLPKPTPMDVSSGNTNLSRNKNFNAKELFTQVVENTEDYTVNPQEPEQPQYYENFTDNFQIPEEQNPYFPTTPCYTNNPQYPPIQTPYENVYYQPEPTSEFTVEQDENFIQVPDKIPET